jgi:phosphoribosyl-ATP pyrophosphohydrolase/phosphoribosyl-AMP cyclohydrolase
MNVDFSKYSDGLVPVIIQDDETQKVLMLGFMNEEALRETEGKGKVTFYSRSKNRLWVKGESSGNFLEVKAILPDCDNDTLLVKVHPVGPVCHTGADTCFFERNYDESFLSYLQNIIALRRNAPINESYVTVLFNKGINKIAQKVGEEAVELVIEATGNDNEAFLNEAADLLFHYLILLHSKGFTLDNVSEVLKHRHSKRLKSAT